MKIFGCILVVLYVALMLFALYMEKKHSRKGAHPTEETHPMEEEHSMEERHSTGRGTHGRGTSHGREAFHGREASHGKDASRGRSTFRRKNEKRILRIHNSGMPVESGIHCMQRVLEQKLYPHFNLRNDMHFHRCVDERLSAKESPCPSPHHPPDSGDNHYCVLLDWWVKI